MKARLAAFSAATALFSGCIPTTDIDCPESTDQISGACLVRCSADDECLVGEVCDLGDGTGVCLAGLSERPVILDFSARVQTVARGRPVRLSYATSSAVRVSIDHGVLVSSSAASGVLWTNPLLETTTFKLTAYGNSGRSEQTVTVQVVERNEAPTIMDLTASPAQLRAGELTTIAWRVAGADRIKIMSGDMLIHSTIDARGSIAYFPTKVVTIVLIAENQHGESREELPLDVEVVPPVIGTFSATPNAAFVGGRINFSWMTTATESIEILYQGTDLVFTTDDREQVESGEYSWVLPQVEHNQVSFTLVANGTGGQQVSRDVTVVINN